MLAAEAERSLAWECGFRGLVLCGKVKLSHRVNPAPRVVGSACVAPGGERRLGGVISVGEHETNNFG